MRQPGRCRKLTVSFPARRRAGIRQAPGQLQTRPSGTDPETKDSQIPAKNRIPPEYCLCKNGLFFHRHHLIKQKRARHAPCCSSMDKNYLVSFTETSFVGISATARVKSSSSDSFILYCISVPSMTISHTGWSL